MDDAELNELVTAWIIGQDEYKEMSDATPHWWAIERVMDWKIDGEPELLWRFILEAYKRDMSDIAFSVLAAGPMEDLLADYGPDYIDRVERLAQENERFNDLLGGVWHLDPMTDEVWERVQKVRMQVW